MSVLKAEHLEFIYGLGTPFKKNALVDFSFEVEPGEIIGVMGHTGSGKSTMAQIISGLLEPESGKLYFEDKELPNDKASRRQLHFSVGLVFQYPEYQLFDDTVFSDISFGPKNMGLPEEEIKSRVMEAAQMVGLKNELLEKSPFDLSGGEKRRAAIAGVIAMKPKVLILDEPTAGLDPKGRRDIYEMIKNYNKTTNAAIIFISHNMDDIADLAHKVLVMNKGHNVMFDTTENVFSRSDELLEMGLDVPSVTGIIRRLKEKGINLPDNIYTVDKAVEAIIGLKNKK